ncbi:Methionine--tRNA ligase, chloroplastic/mitochondrial [Orobanche gracilis]
MACRVQYSIKNSLRLFLQSASPIIHTTFKPQRVHFRNSNYGMFYCTYAAAEPFVLTTPLYYVTAPPHMGSAYTTIAADAIARFQKEANKHNVLYAESVKLQRLLGNEVIFITGTDEHGEKIASSAAANGSGTSEHCDLISQAYKSLWTELNISYDKFIRTTDPNHEAIVKEFYSKVVANGDIYCADYDGLYCVNCEEYKDEKELLDNNCCPMHLNQCVRRKEVNYFFALSKYQKRLEQFLAENPEFVQPSFRLNEVQGWIKRGLRDFSISRASMNWGIPVPNDANQTIYVWFDALLGYISALSEDKKQPNLQTAISSGWPASLHLIGKDILRFHAVYWPAMLMSAGVSLPKKVFGHGFLTKGGLKMGKSLGNILEPTDLVHRFGPDAVRYFFLKEVELGSDGDYSEDRFISIINANLANTIGFRLAAERGYLMMGPGVSTLEVGPNGVSTREVGLDMGCRPECVVRGRPVMGNLLNRTLGLLRKNCQSTIAIDSTIAAEENAFKDTVEKLVKKARQHYESLELSSACDAVLEIGNAGNVYINQKAPWFLFKQGGSSFETASKDIVNVLEAMRIVAIAISPITPSLALRIYTQLGYSQDQFDAATWNDTRWGGLKHGQITSQPIPVFARIERESEWKDDTCETKEANKESRKTQMIVEV